MKPIKPKPMPKWHEKWLNDVASGAVSDWAFTVKEARSILAALAYERKRAEYAEARAHVADHLAAVKPGDADDHVKHMAEFARRHLSRAEVVTPECRRAFTEAVVPKANGSHRLDKAIEAHEKAVLRARAAKAERQRKKKG